MGELEANGKGPLRPLRRIVLEGGYYVNRLLQATPTLGTVRIEWASAVGQLLIPTNWSRVSLNLQVSPFIPKRFQVPDAQNLAVRECIEKDFEWLLLLEDDVIPPNDLFVKLNCYMRDGRVPVVSGLYYTKSEPSEPLVFRGRGTGSFVDWERGDHVWCDGVPTGCLLIHSALLRAMWDESEPYETFGQTTRRVFQTPSNSWIDPETGYVSTQAGTSDLDWCQRVMEGEYFCKSGWTHFAELEHPFLVDTSILCMHIDPDGNQYPAFLQIAIPGEVAEQERQLTLKG